MWREGRWRSECGEKGGGEVSRERREVEEMEVEEMEEGRWRGEMEE